MRDNDGDCCPPIKRASGSPFRGTAATIVSVVVAGYAFWRDLPPLNEAGQRVFGGPFANSFAHSATSGGADAALPQKRPVLENTERNQTRPGVIRTHDQGIMSPLL